MEEVKPVFTQQHELLVSIETLMNKMEPVIVERFYFEKPKDRLYWIYGVFGLTEFWGMDQKNGYSFHFVSVSKIFLTESLMKGVKPVVDEKHAFDFRFSKNWLIFFRKSGLSAIWCNDQHHWSFHQNLLKACWVFLPGIDGKNLMRNSRAIGVRSSR